MALEEWQVLGIPGHEVLFYLIMMSAIILILVILIFVWIAKYVKQEVIVLMQPFFDPEVWTEVWTEMTEFWTVFRTGVRIELSSLSFGAAFRDSAPVPDHDIRLQAVAHLDQLQANQGSLDDECTICTDLMSHPAVLSPCKHAFDFQCIMQWLRPTNDQHHNHCPLCQAVVQSVRHLEVGEELIEKPEEVVVESVV